MESNAAALQTIFLWILIIVAVLFLPALVYILSVRQKKQENEWKFVAKGKYYKVGARKVIYRSVLTTILFTDGRNCTVVDILDTDLPAPGTYVEVYKTKKGNNFKIEIVPIPPSSCL